MLWAIPDARILQAGYLSCRPTNGAVKLSAKIIAKLLGMFRSNMVYTIVEIAVTVTLHNAWLIYSLIIQCIVHDHLL